MNDTLKTIHALLIKQVALLSRKLGDVDDVDMAQKISTEIQEITHRVNVIQNLLFAKESQQLDAKLAPIQAANSKLSAVISNLKSVADFVSTVGSFLTCVDDAIDLAKHLV